jgi:hypothetical protein
MWCVSFKYDGEKHGGARMFTIEMLAVDWDDREHPTVIHRIPSEGTLGDANMIAKSLLDDAKRGGLNGYQILDEHGEIAARSWERTL